MYIATHSKELKPEGKKQWLKVNSINIIVLSIFAILFIAVFHKNTPKSLDSSNPDYLMGVFKKNELPTSAPTNTPTPS